MAAKRIVEYLLLLSLFCVAITAGKTPALADYVHGVVGGKLLPAAMWGQLDQALGN